MKTTERATCWSLTINNPTQDDREHIALARQRGWKVSGQPEKGESGTLHYQLAVHTPQVRFSQVKKAFPRAHIEIARNPAALQSYVRKPETRTDELPTLSESSARYPSLSTYWKLIYEEALHILSHPPDEDILCQMNKSRRLDLLDEATSRLISKGYHVESFAVNPNVRSAFAKFAPALMQRAYTDRQTDRQRELFSHDSDYTHAPEEEDASLQEEADATPRWTQETGDAPSLQIPWAQVHEGDDS